MGLLDVLNGMANGPSGRPDPADVASGGMSKVTMALLAFLGYKAYRNWSGSQSQPDYRRDDEDDRYPPERGQDRGYDRGRYADEGGRGPSTAGGMGGLGDVLRDLIGGGQGRSEAVRRGISNTVDDFDRAGDGDVARSWIGRGENRPLTRDRLEASIGEDGIRDLMQHTGMSRDELLETLRQHLPGAIDALTPDGRLPSREEADRNWRH